MPAFLDRRRASGQRHHRFVRLNEKLQFHLLEFARPERKVAGINLVPKRLAYLANPERRLLTRHVQHVLELREDRLRGFRSQIRGVLLALNGPDARLEHEIERTRLGEQRAIFGVEPDGVFDLLRAFADELGTGNSPFLVVPVS